MKKYMLCFLLFALVHVAKAQNNTDRTIIGTTPVSVGKQTVVPVTNPQITKQAVPYSEADRIIQSYPGYHTAVENKTAVQSTNANTKAVVEVSDVATGTIVTTPSQKKEVKAVVGAGEKQSIKKEEVTNAAQPIE